MASSAVPHRPPHSPHLPSRPLRRLTPLDRSGLAQLNQGWLEAYASCGDPGARLRWRNCLVEANLGLVHRVAARFAPTSQLSFNDLVQVGCQGLIRAVEAFDGRRARCLSTFAIPYVRGAIQHELRDRESWIRPPRRLWELRQRARGIQEQRRGGGLSPLAPHDLAAALGCAAAELQEAETLRTLASPLSLDALQCPSPEGQAGGTWLEQLADPRSCQMASAVEGKAGGDPQRRQQLAWLRSRLEAMDALQRRLVVGRVLVGCSWVELGRELGLHPRMAERRCNAALRELRTEAEGWGVRELPAAAGPDPWREGLPPASAGR